MLFISFGVSLAIVEIALRLFNYPYIGCKELKGVSEYHIGRYDSELGWNYTPKTSMVWDGGVTYTFNNEGYRTDDQARSTDFTKPITLLVGDSVLFGHGLQYEDTFGYKLQKELGDTQEVLNFSVQGYGTDQIYLMLQRVMPLYHPKAVIIDYLNDHDSRNVNRDRRLFFPCSRLLGTKPVFSLINQELKLTARPESYTTYDDPRILLLVRRFKEALLPYKRQYQKMLTQKLLLAIKNYVVNNNARLYVINYDAEIQPVQKEDRVLGASTIIEGDKNLLYYLEDAYHPNSLGILRMVGQFLDKFGQDFAVNKPNKH